MFVLIKGICGVLCEILFIYSGVPQIPGARPLWRLTTKIMCLTSLGPQYGTCFWRLALRDGFWIPGNFMYPRFIVYFTTLSVYRTTQGTSNCKRDEYELEQSWDGEGATRFDARLRGLTTPKISLRVTGVPAEIRTNILSNTILKHSCQTKMIGCFLVRRNSDCYVLF